MALRRKMPRLKMITFMHTCCEGHDVGLGLRRFPAHAGGCRRIRLLLLRGYSQMQERDAI